MSVKNAKRYDASSPPFLSNCVCKHHLILLQYITYTHRIQWYLDPANNNVVVFTFFSLSLSSSFCHVLCYSCKILMDLNFQRHIALLYLNKYI